MSRRFLSRIFETLWNRRETFIYKVLIYIRRSIRTSVLTFEYCAGVSGFNLARMVHLKTNLVKLRLANNSPSLGDCLDNKNFFNNRLLVKGTTKCVSFYISTIVIRDSLKINL